MKKAEKSFQNPEGNLVEYTQYYTSTVTYKFFARQHVHETGVFGLGFESNLIENEIFQPNFGIAHLYQVSVLTDGRLATSASRSRYDHHFFFRFILHVEPETTATTHISLTAI